MYRLQLNSYACSDVLLATCGIDSRFSPTVILVLLCAMRFAVAASHFAPLASVVSRWATYRPPAFGVVYD